MTTPIRITKERQRSELDTLSEYEKCYSVFRAVCEGVDCELSYDELQVLQDSGYITDLKRVKKNRWSFMWTDRLRDYAQSSPERQKHLLRNEISDAKE